MRIKSIHIENFKRFSDITISDIPETSKLVLIIGSNGSGKSCLFDAFDWLYKGLYKQMPYQGAEGTNYYQKHTSIEPRVAIELNNGSLI